MVDRRCFVFLFASLSSAVAVPTGPDVLPLVELSLDPPLHPWPQVAAGLQELQESREKVENTNMDQLQQEFNKATLGMRRQIGDVVGRALRIFDDPALAKQMFTKSVLFRQTPQASTGSSVLSMKVNVVPASPPDASLKARVDSIEFQRSDEEKIMFKEAHEEVKSLADFVLNELEVQMKRQVDALVGAMTKGKVRSTSFLQNVPESFPSQANVRVLPTDEGYPTVANMVQEMELRRDVAENLERKRILDKCIDFLIACNGAAESALQTAVARILAQYASMVPVLRA
jgi:hypothetical protein